VKGNIYYYHADSRTIVKGKIYYYHGRISTSGT